MIAAAAAGVNTCVLGADALMAVAAAAGVDDTR